MSGNPTGSPTGSNVVPMPHAQAPAQAQSPMPFPMWGGGGSLPWGPGCCPPGGMDALMKCYCDVQAATAFICSVMVQCIQTNPAVTAAIIAAIEASGSNVPLLGVTNGENAQPGQVGEFVEFLASAAYDGTINQTVSATMGVLQPGDWDFWFTVSPSTTTTTVAAYINPMPTGFNTNLYASLDPGTGAQVTTFITSTGRALISVPSLVAISVNLNWVATSPPGTASIAFMARRRR